MFPPRFEYRRAESVGEALDLLGSNEDAELLAGGHSLLPDAKNGEADPDLVIDIGGIDELAGIEAGEGATRIGALTTYADLLDSTHLERVAPAIVEAASKLGDRQIRNRGTIGGNLAYAHPGADLPAAAIATDATVELRGNDGERAVRAAEFFVDERETAMDDDELLTAVRVPHRGRVESYVKKTHPATGYALVGVAASVAYDDGQISEARIAANGALDHAVRLVAVEDALLGTSGDGGDRERAAERATDGIDGFRSDPHASGEFREHLLSVYVEEAVAVAIERARAGG